MLRRRVSKSNRAAPSYTKIGGWRLLRHPRVMNRKVFMNEDLRFSQTWKKNRNVISLQPKRTLLWNYAISSAAARHRHTN